MDAKNAFYTIRLFQCVQLSVMTTRCSRDITGVYDMQLMYKRDPRVNYFVSADVYRHMPLLMYGDSLVLTTRRWRGRGQTTHNVEVSLCFSAILADEIDRDQRYAGPKWDVFGDGEVDTTDGDARFAWFVDDWKKPASLTEEQYRASVRRSFGGTPEAEVRNWPRLKRACPIFLRVFSAQTEEMVNVLTVNFIWNHLQQLLTERRNRHRGILRVVPMLMLRRKQATERVYHPSRHIDTFNPTTIHSN